MLEQHKWPLVLSVFIMRLQPKAARRSLWTQGRSVFFLSVQLMHDGKFLIDTPLLWCNNSLYIDGEVLEFSCCSCVSVPDVLLLNLACLWVPAASDRLWIRFKASRSRGCLTRAGDPCDANACQSGKRHTGSQTTKYITDQNKKKTKGN